MGSWCIKLGLRLAALGSVGFVLGGCAQERAPINRVQPNALAKSFFVGADIGESATEDDPEFYAAATIVDVPYGVNHGLFSGQAGGLKRIKWQITEDELIARATYETYEGVDGRGSRVTNNGQVVASFPIVSHFDIRRSYNPSTGEESNVIEENTSDRPWYERSYFRVDWSTNLVTSSVWWDPMSQNEIFGGSYDAEPLAYYVNEPDDPDAPVFSPEERYFDITQKLFVTPQTLTIDGTTYPTCFWRGTLVSGGNSETGVCESSEIKVRMSFKQVPEPGDSAFTDYEPKNYDGARMDAFGIFTQDRKGYDNNYGVIDDKWYRFAQRYNIWQESHAKNAEGVPFACATPDILGAGLNPSRDEDRNGTDDDCEDAGSGSQCNLVTRQCTIPYARREIRPVAWHNHLMNEDKVVTTQSRIATEEWDVAMRTAVQAARYTECVRTDGHSVADTPFSSRYDEAVGHVEGDRKRACGLLFYINGQDEVDLKQTFARNHCEDMNGRGAPQCAASDPTGVAAMRPVVVFCHNPVRGPEPGVYRGDDPACGEAGLVTRPGDLRYHSINVWPTPEDSSPWGFGPSWSDPLTGEIIQASINVYNTVTNVSAQSVIDTSRWYLGELTPSEVQSGDYVRAWVGAEQSPLRQAMGGTTIPRAQIDQHLAGLSHVTFDQLASIGDPTRRASAFEVPRDIHRQLQQHFAANKAPPAIGGSNRAEFESRIEMVKNSPMEAQLVGPQWVEAAGLDPSSALAQNVLDVASPLRGLDFRRAQNVQRAVQLQLARQGMCLMEAEAPEPSSALAIGRLLNEKFGEASENLGENKQRLEKMWDYVRGRMHYGVILHEMGHTIGERHNFTSTYDAYAWRPQYWQLRTKDGTVTEPCRDETTDPTGENCIGPRYYDPVTQDELENSLYMWAQTTVMDYSGDLTHDWVGLGVYDYAAARMFYADVVDVRDDIRFDGRPDSEVDGESVEGHLLDFVDFPGFLVSRSVTINGGPGATINGQCTAPEGCRTIHYSEWANYFGLLRDCRDATEEELSPPPWYDAEVSGPWHPVFDGEIVHGKVCSRPPVDYVKWRDLRADVLTDLRLGEDPQYFTPRRARTDEGEQSRIRVPYSFASDEFRDGWSPSTQTRDSGGDAYEQALWYLHNYENRHIFTNFRRNRTNFSIVRAYQRDLGRTHVKLANLAQGLSILHDYYFGELARNSGGPHSAYIQVYEGEGGFMRQQAVAASVAFDHLTRVLTRPQTGDHFTLTDDVYMSGTDRLGAQANDLQWTVTIPNGTSLAGQDVTFGGRPLDNGFEYGRGYWYFDYINQAGSYYEKTYAFDMLLNAYYQAPSAFSRWDGIDGRWRHTNFANLFPEGTRRLLGAMVTEDLALLAPRMAAENGVPLLEFQDGSACQINRGTCYPSRPLGWVSWVPEDGPEVCWPGNGTYVCGDTSGGEVLPGVPTESVPLEPQLGFETQKFAVFWAYVYMPSSQVLDFVDMMRIWKMGSDVDPEYAQNLVEWRDPLSGLRYFAKSYGEEQLFGKTYDKGIAAKMIQWVNRLTERAYELDETTPFDPITGAANVKLDADGLPILKRGPGVVPNHVTGAVTCDDSQHCVKLRNYRGLLDFTRDMARYTGFAEPELPTYE